MVLLGSENEVSRDSSVEGPGAYPNLSTQPSWNHRYPEYGLEVHKMVPSGGPKRSFLPTSSSLLAHTQSLAKGMVSYQKMKTYRLGDIEIQGVTCIAAHPYTETLLDQWKYTYITSWQAYLSSGGWSSCCLEAWWKQRRKQELAHLARSAHTWQFSSNLHQFFLPWGEAALSLSCWPFLHNALPASSTVSNDAIAEQCGTDKKEPWATEACGAHL